MEVHLKCLGDEYWKITKNVYNVPQNGLVTTAKIKDTEHNIRDKEALLSGLTNSEMTNVMGLKTTHEIWKKLETLYEGDAQVKVAKLQSLKGKYEALKMGEDENITSFMAKVNELVMNMRCAGGTLEEDEMFLRC